MRTLLGKPSWGIMVVMVVMAVVVVVLDVVVAVQVLKSLSSKNTYAMNKCTMVIRTKRNTSIIKKLERWTICLEHCCW